MLTVPGNVLGAIGAAPEKAALADGSSVGTAVAGVARRRVGFGTAAKGTSR